MSTNEREPVQLLERNEYKNRFTRGITRGENYGTNPLHDTGVPQTGFKGDLKDQGRGRFGVPIPGSRSTPRVKPKPACSATTKKGTP